MSDHSLGIEADFQVAIDRGEMVSRMEPLVLAEGSRHRSALADLAVELAARSSGFRRSLPTGVLTALAGLVRAMNCYYSNLIEGHDTHPIDIERALKNDYSTNTEKRNLQLEAKAHINVQQWIDHGGLHGRAATASGICEIHRRFGELLPDDLLWSEKTDSHDRERVVPGELRKRDVKVGQHIPISPGAVPRFVERLERIYSGLGKAETIISAAAAHHRLLWVHPFLDGNGRVARLMSYAMLHDALDTGGVWSIARGLARNVRSYKSHLAECDMPRRNDLDGRGHLSEEGLASFTHFFLATCLDQVTYMEALVQPNNLHSRIMLWAEDEARAGAVPTKAGIVLEALLYRGELPRGEVAAIVGIGDRQARRIVAALVNRGVVAAETARSPLRLVFPAALAPRWMPGLFPDQA